MEKYADQENFDFRTFHTALMYGSQIADMVNPSGKDWGSEMDDSFEKAAADFPEDQLLVPQMKQAMPMVWNLLGRLIVQPEHRCVALNILFNYAANGYQPDGTQRENIVTKTPTNPNERVNVFMASVPLYYNSAMRSGLYNIGDGRFGVTKQMYDRALGRKIANFSC